MDKVVEDFQLLLDGLAGYSLLQLEENLNELLERVVGAHNDTVVENDRLVGQLQLKSLEVMDAVSPKQAEKLKFDIESLKAHQTKDQATISDLKKKLAKAEKAVPDFKRRNDSLIKSNKKLTDNLKASRDHVKKLTQTIEVNSRARRALKEQVRDLESKLVAQGMMPIWRRRGSFEQVLQWPEVLTVKSDNEDSVQHPGSPTLLYIGNNGVSSFCMLDQKGDLMISQEPVEKTQEGIDIMMTYLEAHCNPSEKEASEKGSKQA